MEGLTQDRMSFLAVPSAVVKAFGRCMRCGRRLSDPASVAAGIGPICASKHRVAGDEEREGQAETALVPISEKIVFLRQGDRWLTNVPRLVVQHSPSGFAWGYGGSGPADLALNIVEAALRQRGHRGPTTPLFRGRCFQDAWRLHQSFKARFICGIGPERGGELEWSEIGHWIDERMQQAA